MLAELAELAGVDRFDLDVAASADNAKAARYYGVKHNGLAQPWSGRVYCNPPYSDCRSWVAKADAEQANCEVVAMLLPANRTEQAWWHEFIEPGRRAGTLQVFFLQGRRRHEHPPEWVTPPKGDRPPFGHCLVVWR
jgi:phage N-6-adenine-methyltransferase